MRMREAFKNLYSRELSILDSVNNTIAVLLNIVPVENAYPTLFHQAGVMMSCFIVEGRLLQGVTVALTFA